ncbi:MAG: peptidoglycan-associated lipoprotein Pal [candidate division Zixibacteria bacterium]|nr:peptidoglycan-associated lipoprotein Pal [candidate division Zixibacteria bacterium]
MRRIIVLLLFGIAAFVMSNGCGHPPPPPPPPPPAVVETNPPPPPPVQPKEEPKPVLQENQFQTVYFDFDKYTLRADAKASLDANFALLKEFPDAIVKVEGHCDERGTVEYNLSLGEKRARAVMDYLVGKGIAPAQLSIISYGKERPVDPGHNEAAWGKNRRAEFKVISQ